jgi:signal transduction histidine kinase
VSGPMAAAARRIPVIEGEDRKLAGVCAAIARQLGIDVRVVRIAFVILTIAGGIGVALYGLAYLTMTSSEAEVLTDPTAVLREVALSWREGLGAGVLAAAVVLAGGAGSHVVLPVGAGVGTAMLLWRSGIGLSKRGRVGAALMIAGAVLVARALPALSDVQSFTFPVIVVLAGSVLLFGPWWLRMAQALTAERTARIRAQERAEVAAHLHDSVLQTLALIQRHAEDPTVVGRLARSQERELRAWLYEPTVATGGTWAGLVARLVAEVEADHAVTVDPVVVGDLPVDDAVATLGQAAKEAVVNAAKHSGAASVSLYSEVTSGSVTVFVRDRGTGFDPTVVPTDRRGLRDSVVGRLTRLNGTATVRSAPGEGTEVELCLPRGERAEASA